MSALEHEGPDPRVAVRLEEVLTDTLDQIEVLDQGLHAFKELTRSRLHALRTAADPALMDQLEKRAGEDHEPDLPGWLERVAGRHSFAR